MTVGLKLALGAYNRVGRDVLRAAVDHPLVSDVAVFTHEPAQGTPDVRDEAEGLGVWWTTRRLGEVEPPFKPDVISLVYYRYIISAETIASVGGKIFNVHPSLLPRHRGCSSVPWAIIEGDCVTGVTFHYVDPGIDTGRILTQSTLQIADDETQASLYERCMDRALEHWPAALLLVKEGFEGVPQDDAKTCYHPRGAPHGGSINPDWPDDYTERFIRAMHFPPYPNATYRGTEVLTFAHFEELRDGPGA